MDATLAAAGWVGVSRAGAAARDASCRSASRLEDDDPSLFAAHRIVGARTVGALAARRARRGAAALGAAMEDTVVMVIGARDLCVGGDAGAFEGHGRGRARDVKCRIDQIFLCDAATVGATIVASSDPQPGSPYECTFLYKMSTFEGAPRPIPPLGGRGHRCRPRP